MYILGIDYGTKKLGVAILEEESSLVSPLPLVKNDNNLFSAIKKIVADYRIKTVVLGMPSYEDTAKKVHKFGDTLAKECSLSLEYTSEDNTSLGIKHDLTTKKQKENLDSFSAVAILEQWVSSRQRLK